MPEIIETTLTEIADDNLLKGLASFDLVAKTEGSVRVIQNIDVFKKKAAIALAGINKNLVTDEDFDIAASDIAECKLWENRLVSARDAVISGNEDISALVQDINQEIPKFSSNRFELEKLVKARKVSRKNEIVEAGIKDLTERLANSPIKHGFKIDKQLIESATKNKKKFSAMESSVELCILEQIAVITELEKIYAENIAAIDAAISETVATVFQDRTTLALGNTDVVAMTIVARKETYNRELREKEERVKAAIKKADDDRIERERLAKIEAEKVVVFEKPVLAADPPEPFTTATFTPPPFDVTEKPKEGDFEKLYFTKFERIPAFSPDSDAWQGKKYTITIEAQTVNIKALVQYLEKGDGVSSVKVQ